MNYLCSNALAVFCYANKLDEVPQYPGFYSTTVCLDGESFARLKLRNRSKEQKEKARQLEAQEIEPSKALVEFPITSDELQCPKMSRGKVKNRILKVCCQRPWNQSAWLRRCKDCKFNFLQPKYNSKGRVALYVATHHCA